MAQKVRIQKLRDGRWVACGSMTFTPAQGKRLLQSGLYSQGCRLVEVGTGKVFHSQ